MRIMVVLCATALLAAGVRADDGAGLVGPFAKDEYPQALIDRPLTLPAGMVEGELGATFSSVRFAAPEFNVTGIDQWIGDVTVRAGITDRIQLDVGTSFSLDYVEHGPVFQGTNQVDLRPSLASWQHVVPTRLSFLALDTETLDTAVRLTIPFTAHASRTLDFGRGGSVDLSNGTGRVVPLVALDAPTRWRLTDWLWLRAGQDLFAVSTADGFAQFQFDFGVGVQPHPSLAVTLDSSIAAIVFDGSGESFSRTLRDNGNLALEGTWSPCRWFDLVGALAIPDVGRGFDDYLTRVAVRVRI